MARNGDPRWVPRSLTTQDSFSFPSGSGRADATGSFSVFRVRHFFTLIKKGNTVRPIARISRALCMFVVVQLAGCASFEFTKPLPAQQRPVAVKVSGDEVSGWTDLPLGVYRVPDSHVIISGHQKGQAAGLLFGLVGIAISHAANASAGADAITNAEKQLRIKLNDPLQASIDRLLAAGAFGSQFTGVTSADPKLQLTPALVLSFVNDNDIRPYVIVRAALTGPDGKAQWNGRYIASSGESRPLLGAGGWLENDAAHLKTTIARNLELSMRTLATDVSRPFPRDENRLVTVLAQFPFVRAKFQVKGYPLSEDESSLTFVPKIGDVIVFSGVNVMDKKFITSRLATQDDPVFKVAEEEPSKK
jgi:hypothetical protein